MTHYIASSFRVLDDGSIGEIQALRLDKDWGVNELANEFECSVSTIYEAIKAIPASQTRVTKKWETKMVELKKRRPRG